MVTIACSALSGVHAPISPGTTLKLLPDVAVQLRRHTYRVLHCCHSAYHHVDHQPESLLSPSTHWPHKPTAPRQPPQSTSIDSVCKVLQ
ncbi:hypothetical protein [Mycobacterium uberis]|uniref:hypothetical protein n=1 Tax=Mycobacterium uberis TaxID=2162698 RepID=UPI003C73B89D